MIELEFGDVLPFGKYAFSGIEDILEEDPQYIQYLLEEEAIALSDELMHELHLQLNAK